MNNQSMVYLNKIFSDLQIHSCPLMSSLTATEENFDQQLTFFDHKDDCNCDCGCGRTISELSDDLDFVIDSSEVIVSDFDLAEPSCISPCNVTVDGIPVDAIDFFNERYMAATNDLMTRVSDCTCIERGRSTKGFFLISGIGGFKAKLTIILRGSVFGCGICKRFRLRLTTKNHVCVNIPGKTTFAVAELCLPCTTGGIAPIINFSFTAKANLLNPVICKEESSGLCGLTVKGCLVAEPIANVQVTRQTLFRTHAEAVNVPCDDLEKCRQTFDCGEEDDDSNALRLRDRCCDDAVRRKRDDDCGCHECDRDRDRDHGCGCHERDRDRDRDDDCGCHKHDKDNDCECCQRDRNRNNISFQFNGRNGCSF